MMEKERLEKIKSEWNGDDILCVDDIDWLIEQAERSEIYQKALMEIGAKYQPPASKIANDSLWIADYKRNG